MQKIGIVKQKREYELKNSYSFSMYFPVALKAQLIHSRFSEILSDHCAECLIRFDGLPFVPTRVLDPFYHAAGKASVNLSCVEKS